MGRLVQQANTSTWQPKAVFLVQQLYLIVKTATSLDTAYSAKQVILSTLPCFAKKSLVVLYPIVIFAWMRVPATCVIITHLII